MNRVILTGRIGTDVELKTFPSGAVLAKFSMVTTDHVESSSGEWKEIKEWHSIQVWGNDAIFVHKYLGKGTAVEVEGSLSSAKLNTGSSNALKLVFVNAKSVKKSLSSSEKK